MNNGSLLKSGDICRIIKNKPYPNKHFQTSMKRHIGAIVEITRVTGNKDEFGYRLVYCKEVDPITHKKILNSGVYRWTWREYDFIRIIDKSNSKGLDSLHLEDKLFVI